MATKILKLIGKIFNYVVVGITLIMVVFTIMAATAYEQKDRSFFGLRMYIVLSDSMKGEFDAGDLIITRTVDPSTLNEGDIISFISMDEESEGVVITHQIKNKIIDTNGVPGFVTQGINNYDENGNLEEDDTLVAYNYVLGKYLFHIPNAGYFFEFLKTTPGYIVFILIPFSVLLITQGITCVNAYKNYKKEQNEEIEEEKRLLKAKQEETDKLLAELKEWKNKVQQEKLNE